MLVITDNAEISLLFKKCKSRIIFLMFGVEDIHLKKKKKLRENWQQYILNFVSEKIMQLMSNKYALKFSFGILLLRAYLGFYFFFGKFFIFFLVNQMRFEFKYSLL